MKKEVYLAVFIISMLIVYALEIPVDLIEGGKNLRVSSKDSMNFRYSGFRHKFIVKDIQEDHVTLTLENLERTMVKKDVSLVVNDIREVDVDNDNRPDLSIGLVSIDNKIGVFNLAQIPKEVEVKEAKPSKEKQEEPLTPEETSEIQNLMKTLQNPYITQGLALVNGKATLFNVVKGIGIQKAQEAVSKDNPEAGILFGLYGLYNQYSGILSPAEKKEENKVTGKVIGIPEDIVLAAFDGKDLYLNFRVNSERNVDLSFLFKNNGDLLGKNINIRKDFSDLTINLDSGHGSSVIINEDVFNNVDGEIELMKDEVKINRLDLISNNDDNKLHVDVENPFYAKLNRNGRISYDGKNIGISNGILDFENKEHVVNFEDRIKADYVALETPNKLKVNTVNYGDYRIGATSNRFGETTLHVFGNKEIKIDNIIVRANNYDLKLNGDVVFNSERLRFISGKETEYSKGNRVIVKKLVSIS